MSPQELISYYANLLILQYRGQQKAHSTVETVVTGTVMPQTSVQTITFSAAPVSGSFVLNYQGNPTTAINWNDSTATIQSKLQAVSGLSLVTVTGSISSQSLIVTMSGAIYPTELLIVSSNTLGVTVDIADFTVNDEILPLAVQDGFNLNPTVQTISLSDIAASGSFVITYQGNNSSAIQWNASLKDIQDALNILFGVNYVTVTGSILTQQLVLTFNVVQSPTSITVTSNTLQNALSVPIIATITNNVANGIQLDILGKYVGVTRSGFGQSGPITLNDSDFLKLIQIAIIRNMQGSSLATIVSLFFTYFPGEIQVFDYANTSPMFMGYLINSSLTSQDLIQLLISEGLIPQPMGVGVSIVSFPTTNLFFGLCDYANATPTQANTMNTEPLNCATSYTSGNYNTNWPFLDYQDAIIYNP